MGPSSDMQIAYCSSNRIQCANAVVHSAARWTIVHSIAHVKARGSLVHVTHPLPFKAMKPIPDLSEERQVV